jgi:hypothetical protein
MLISTTIMSGSNSVAALINLQAVIDDTYDFGVVRKQLAKCFHDPNMVIRYEYLFVCGTKGRPYSVSGELCGG